MISEDGPWPKQKLSRCNFVLIERGMIRSSWTKANLFLSEKLTSILGFSLRKHDFGNQANIKSKAC